MKEDPCSPVSGKLVLSTHGIDCFQLWPKSPPPVLRLVYVILEFTFEKRRCCQFTFKKTPENSNWPHVSTVSVRCCRGTIYRQHLGRQTRMKYPEGRYYLIYPITTFIIRSKVRVKDNTDGCVRTRCFNHFTTKATCYKSNLHFVDNNWTQLLFVNFVVHVTFIMIAKWLKHCVLTGCRCNERIKAKTEGVKRIAYTGFHG